MVLTITYNGENTQNIGFLLHKNPQRPQVFELSHGRAYVFYPELSDEKTVSRLMGDLVDAGNLGVKTARGFYDYADGRDEEALRDRDEKFIKIAKINKQTKIN